MGYSCRYYHLPDDGFETLDAIIELLPEELAFEVVLTPVDQGSLGLALKAEAFTSIAAERLADTWRSVVLQTPDQ